MINRRMLPWLFAGLFAATGALVQAQAGKAPDALIKEVSTDVLDTLKADKTFKQGDLQKINALVDAKVLPYVDLQRMTAASVGRYWRQATPAQQKSLEEQFKLLLVRTYAGALSQVSDQTVDLRPSRSSPDDKEVVVRTEVKGRGDPIQLDYRLEQTPAGWKIYDVNVLGVWLVQSYQNMFSEEIGANGIDGLIAKLTARNKGGAARS